MNADEAMAHYEARRKLAAANGDEIAEQHWAERIQRVSGQREMMRQAARRCAPASFYETPKATVVECGVDCECGGDCPFKLGPGATTESWVDCG